MLKSLSIKNVVLIDSLDIDFANGFVVLSGETGAGKSILLDSLGLLLGKRSEASLIRSGADKLSVTGVFEISKSNKIYDILSDYDIETDDDIIIKRTISLDGKNKIFFNDNIITLKTLKELSSYLLEIHGQNDNQGLLNPLNHCSILDEYALNQCLLENLQTIHKEYKITIRRLKEKQDKLEKAKQDEENIVHWVKELKKVSPQKGEEDILKARRLELINSEKILENLNIAYACLNEAQSVEQRVSSALNSISKINSVVNNKYIELEQNIENIVYNLRDITEVISTCSNDINYNQNEIDDIETRLFTLRDLAKKHQTSIDLLIEKQEELENLLEGLENDEDILKELNTNVMLLREKYIDNAEILSKARSIKAKEIDLAITKELPDLKMERAKFVTNINKKDEKDWSEYGFDDVCFEVSTNPNTPMGAINKIASGGELSRFMLALKVNLAKNSSQETLIFDEIDAGIGGATAEAVGSRLQRLAEDVQVLVVTHSPQVAAYSNQHFKVEKITINDITTTSLIELNAVEKTEEIARMLAGEIITDEARAAANVLIKKSK